MLSVNTMVNLNDIWNIENIIKLLLFIVIVFLLVKILFPNFRYNHWFTKKTNGFKIPPNCYLCKRGLDTEDKCDLIYFTETPLNVVKSLSINCDNAEWFCTEEHSRLAKQFKHLTYKEATEQLKCIIGETREDSQNIRLDGLFMSECTSCGAIARWTGIIDEEEFENSIELGVLMYCDNCVNSFLDIKGSLQEYLTKTPPVFIPGRRL